MKRILATGSIAVLAMVGLAGSANAAPSDSACFGQVHKTVNSGGVPGVDNVGQARSGRRRGPGQERSRGVSLLRGRLLTK